MVTIEKIKRYIKCPSQFVIFLNRYPIGHLLPDKFCLKHLYRARIGKNLNLKQPKSYNEKLQWLKLHDRKPEYIKMVDKFEAKKYVAERIGEEYIVPNYGVWSSFDEIDFDALPAQFVLKCTHDCGGLVICRDKSTLDKDMAREKINRCLKRNYYWSSREWPYKTVQPRIIAEAYMEDEKNGDLPDYKFFAFDGEVKMMFIATERQSKEETKFDFFDANFNHLPFLNGHPNAKKMPEKPQNFEKMKELAAKLSEGIPQVRIDFYEVNGKIYFGEITFFHWSGLVKFEPEEWDEKIGEWIVIPNQ